MSLEGTAGSENSTTGYRSCMDGRNADTAKVIEEETMQSQEKDSSFIPEYLVAAEIKI